MMTRFCAALQVAYIGLAMIAKAILSLFTRRI